MNSVIRNVYCSLGRYRALYVISAIELIVIVLWILHANVEGSADRFSYYEAYDVLLSGNLDEVRTPAYPLVVGIFRSIFGESLSKVIVFIFQSMAFLFSIKWFGKTLENIVEYKRVGYWFTAIYALYPGILSFCGLIITESLSISLMTAVIYLVAEAYYHNSFKKAALSGILCMILWMLRPALMPVTVIMLVFWGCLWMFKGKAVRKTAISGFCATLVSIVGIGGYSTVFYRQYHKAGLTYVSTWNNYFLIREAGAVDTDRIENPDIKARIGSIIGHSNEGYDFGRTYIESVKLHEELGIYDFDKFVNQQIKQHTGEIISFLYHERLDKLLDSDCVCPGKYGALPPPAAALTRIIRVKNGTAFLIFLTGLSVLIYVDIKKRRISYFIWLLYSLFAANYFTIWIGAMNEYSRLTAPIYPVLLAISCWLLDKLMILADKGETAKTT